MSNTVPGTHWVLENVAIIIYQIPRCYLFLEFMGTSNNVVISQTTIHQEFQDLLNFITKRSISNSHRMALCPSPVSLHPVGLKYCKTV